MAPVKKALAKPVAKPVAENQAKGAVRSVSAAAQRIEQRRLTRKRMASARARAPGTTRDATVPQPSRVRAVSPLTKKDLKAFRDQLVELRERLLGDIKFLTTDNLHRMGRETGADLSGSSQHSADHGTDNFDREFALSLASSEQDNLYEVDEAILRIDHDEYGICEYTGQPIEKARLEVIPYTRFSVQAQTLLERGRAKYRPFGQVFKGW